MAEKARNARLNLIINNINCSKQKLNNTPF